MSDGGEDWDGNDWDGEEETQLDNEPECEDTSDLDTENIIKDIYNFKAKIYTHFRNKVHENDINNDSVYNRDLIILYHNIYNYIIKSMRGSNNEVISKNDIINEELQEELYEIINKIKGIDTNIIDCYIKSIFVTYPYSLNKESIVRV